MDLIFLLSEKEVIETGANLVFSVEGKEKEYLIPHIPPVVYEIKENRIGIHLMEGLHPPRKAFPFRINFEIYHLNDRINFQMP